jgi:hypothetical protein
MHSGRLCVGRASRISEAWARYIADVRERNRRLRALMEELAAARL